MSNAKIDFAIGRYALLEIGQDGPNRLQGHTTYSSFGIAKKAAERYMRDERRQARITIFRIEGTFWLDEKPAMLSDIFEDH